MTNENQTQNREVNVEIVRHPWNLRQRRFSFRVGGECSYANSDVEEFLNTFEGTLEDEFRFAQQFHRSQEAYKLRVRSPCTTYDAHSKSFWENFWDESFLLEHIIPRMNDVINRYNRRIEDQGENLK